MTSSNELIPAPASPLFWVALFTPARPRPVRRVLDFHLADQQRPPAQGAYERRSRRLMTGWLRPEAHLPRGGQIPIRLRSAPWF